MVLVSFHCGFTNMSDVVTPNMNLTLPTVSQTTGPTYATEINTDLNAIDTHDHSSGKGVPVTPSGISITTSLPFNGNNLTTVGGVVFQAGSILSTADALSVNGVDLYYTDGNGNQIRVTQSGGLAGTPGSITNLTAPATASYVAASSKFVWQSAINTAADLDARSILLRNASASSNALTLNPPAGMASNFSLTLPNIPATESFTSVDTSGNFKSVCSVSFGLTESNVKSGVQIPVTNQSKTSAYNILKTDGFVMGDSSGGVFDLTLYSAASFSGYSVVIKKTDSSLTRVNLNTVNGETIDGVSSTCVSIQYETLSLLSNGVSWQVLSRAYPSTWIPAAFTASGGLGGGITAQSSFVRRVGDSLECKVYVVMTNTSGAVGYVGLPSGYTLDPTRTVTGRTPLGTWWINSLSNGYGSTNRGGAVFYDGTGITIAQLGIGSAFSTLTANSFIGGGDAFALNMTVPITGWK